MAWGSALPLGGLWFGSVTSKSLVTRRVRRPIATGAGYQIVSPSYLPLLGVPLCSQGVASRTSDTAAAPQVCLVDEAFVRQLPARPHGARHAHRHQRRWCCRRGQSRERSSVSSGMSRSRPERSRNHSPRSTSPIAQNPWWTATLVVRPMTVEQKRSRQRSEPRSGARRPRSARDSDSDARRTWAARPRHDPAFAPVLVGTFAGLALAAGDGRRVRCAGLLGAAAHARVRRAHRPRRLGEERRLRPVLGNAARVVGTGAVLGLCYSRRHSRSP